jgi:hypothetical protein
MSARVFRKEEKALSKHHAFSKVDVVDRNLEHECQTPHRLMQQDCVFWSRQKEMMQRRVSGEQGIDLDYKAGEFANSYILIRIASPQERRKRGIDPLRETIRFARAHGSCVFASCLSPLKLT